MISQSPLGEEFIPNGEHHWPAKTSEVRGESVGSPTGTSLLSSQVESHALSEEAKVSHTSDIKMSSADMEEQPSGGMLEISL